MYIGAGLVVCQMSVRRLQYFRIFFQIVCRDFPSIHTLAGQQLPQSGRPSKLFYLNPDIDMGIYEHCGIAYLERVTAFSYAVSSVEMAGAVAEMWQCVRTSYVADILPTELPCISLGKNIIIITIIFVVVVVVVVTDFSKSESRLSRLVYR